MGGYTSPSSNGATVVLGIKISLETNQVIEEMAIKETKGNKSEMIRILISEAIEEREKIKEMMENEEYHKCISEE